MTAKYIEPEEETRLLEERGRRMAEAWRQLEPAPGEIAAARARMLRAKRDPKRGRVLPGAVGIAIVLAGSAAFAGWKTGALDRVLMHQATTAAPQVTSPPSPAAAPRSVRSPSGSVPAEPPQVDREAPPIAPDPTHAARIVPSAIAPASTSGTPTPSEVPVPVGAPTPRETWAAAAEALRKADYAGADLAFASLAASSDPRTRDEARLARAQVWVAQGRRVEARSELGSLAKSGATPLVRSRAAEMFRAIPGDSADRPPPGTNHP